MKKKLISLILCGVMAFTLVSCGDGKEKETSTNSNKATTSSSSSSSNSKVDTEESDYKKEESTSSKDEYKTLTIDEALEFHDKKLGEMEQLFRENGYEPKVKNSGNDDSLIDGNTSVSYTEEGSELPYYQHIGYSAEIKDKVVIVRYEFAYYVDKEGIANGTSEVPKAKELFISEPYKVMTGDEISEETLNKIDEAIEDAYLNGNDDKDVELEINGPFKVNIKFDGLEITFQIISDGDGLGN